MSGKLRGSSVVWKSGASRANCGAFLLVALGGFVGAGCSAPGDEALGTAHEAASTPFQNDKTAYDYFRAKGLTNFQAAGVVGNLDQESGVDPTIHQSGGGVGRGIAQWSAGARWDTTPGDNVVQFAQQKGESETSLSLQLDFMWFELTMFPEYGLAKLQASTNVSDAAQAVEDNFEGCVYANFPECDLPQRVKYSMNVLAAYGDDPVQGGGGAGGGGNGTGGGGASSGGAGGAVGASGSSAGGSASGGSGTAGDSNSGGGSIASRGGSTASGGSTVTTAGTANVTNGASGSATASNGGSASAQAGTSSFPLTSTSSSNDSSGCSVSAPHAPGRSSLSAAAALALLGLVSGARRLRAHRAR